jgi:Flp pilus assembly protein TadD
LKLRYILGLSLVHEGGDKVEALDNLQRAAVEIPKAHLLAAQILIESDRHEEAVRHVEEYLLSSPANDSDRQKAGAWLDQLRR